MIGILREGRRKLSGWSFVYVIKKKKQGKLRSVRKVFF